MNLAIAANKTGFTRRGSQPPAAGRLALALTAVIALAAWQLLSGHGAAPGEQPAASPALDTAPSATFRDSSVTYYAVSSDSQAEIMRALVREQGESALNNVQFVIAGDDAALSRMRSFVAAENAIRSDRGQPQIKLVDVRFGP